MTTRKAELECARNEAIATQKAKKLEISDIETMRHYVEDLRSVLGSASIMEQKAFLRSFVKRIDVSKSEVTVNYTLPMSPLNVDKESVAVLGFIQNGGGIGFIYWYMKMMPSPGYPITN